MGISAQNIRSNTVPLIVATALFMQTLDATVLSTALPVIARDFNTNPIHLKLAVTTYLLALAIFIPASGWVADRYGARNVFRMAMLVFSTGSLLCGLSNDLYSLVGARILQGIGGAMMVPVGRLVILRTTEKSELVGAMAWLSVPAMLGPITGPPLGGFITTYLDWRWIFWINIPIAALGIILATRFIPDIRARQSEGFDLTGFLMIGPGLALLLTGATFAGIGLISVEAVVLLILSGAMLIAAYVVHAFRDEAPILDLKLLSIPTFRASVVGGSIFRIGIGASPFLLPLLFQMGFGATAFQSGMMTFAIGVGALTMKTLAPRILRRFGFRNILIINALIAGAFVAMPAAFQSGMPWLLITALLMIGGFSRSLQFTSVNAIAYADVPEGKFSRATSFAAVMQELSGSIGVSVAALGLEFMQAFDGRQSLDASHFPYVFILVGLISASSALIFWRLPPDAGKNLLTKDKQAPAEVTPEASQTSM